MGFIQVLISVGDPMGFEQVLISVGIPMGFRQVMICCCCCLQQRFSFRVLFSLYIFNFSFYNFIFF